MTRWISALSLLSLVLFWTNQGRADPLEYIGKPVRGIPVSSAVKVGKPIFVSGMPAFDANGKLAVGDFPARHMIDTAIILTGGRGERMRPSTTLYPSR